MKDNKLISMIERIDEIENEFMPCSLSEGQSKAVADLGRIIKHKNFLKQNLSELYLVNGVIAHPLNRFVPTDLDGNVLEEPRSEKDIIQDSIGNCRRITNKELKFQQAKQRVLFEGFEMTVNVHGVWYVEKSGGCICSDTNSTVEDVVKFNPTLTQTALKMIGK